MIGNLCRTIKHMKIIYIHFTVQWRHIFKYCACFVLLKWLKLVVVTDLLTTHRNSRVWYWCIFLKTRPLCQSLGKQLV